MPLSLIARKARRAKQKRVSIPKSLVGKVRTVGNFARVANRQEKKWHEFLDGLTTMSDEGTILATSLNIIPLGSGESGRIGRMVRLRSIHLRCTFVLPSSVAVGSQSDIGRLMVILDKQANGAAATVDQVLQTAATHHKDSFMNLENARRFQILADHFCTISNASTVDVSTVGIGGIVRKFWRFNKKVNLPIEYSVAMSPPITISNVRSNNIFLLGISHSGLMQCRVLSRLRYTDS